MEPWITRSNASQQRRAGALIGVVGLLLCWGFRHSHGAPWSGDGDAAGFWLGLFLLPLGLGTLCLGGQTTITVDPRRRLITLVDANALREQRRVMRFADIVDLSLGELGDDEGGTVRYHVIAHLREGRDLALFHGFFEGVHQRNTMEARRSRLWQMVQATTASTPPA